MSWILLAAGGQFINAVVAILDKYIVSDENILPRPFVYAFYSCLIAGGWMFIYGISFLPGMQAVGMPHISNVEWPTIQVVGMSFLAAYAFFMALVSMYTGLKAADASDVLPVIGAISAASTLVLSIALLGGSFGQTTLAGIALLIIGTLMVSQMRFSPSVILHAFHSGLFFALHYIALKGLFLETSFDDGFFWSRISLVLFALSLLLVPTYLAKIKQQSGKTSAKGGLLVLATKVLAGVAGFMLLKATDWGDVAIVQALDGLKFAFIILISLIFGKYIPRTAGENDFSITTIVRKVFYVSIICLGFVLLFV